MAFVLCQLQACSFLGIVQETLIFMKRYVLTPSCSHCGSEPPYNPIYQKRGRKSLPATLCNLTSEQKRWRLELLKQASPTGKPTPSLQRALSFSLSTFLAVNPTFKHVLKYFIINSNCASNRMFLKFFSAVMSERQLYLSGGQGKSSGCCSQCWAILPAASPMTVPLRV